MRAEEELRIVAVSYILVKNRNVSNRIVKTVNRIGKSDISII